MSSIIISQYTLSKEPIKLYLSDRLRHLYILGKSGVGKSTLIHNMLVQDLLQGEGICLIDPHGDLAEGILEHIPRSRTRSVVYLNLADETSIPAWNPLQKLASLSIETQAAHLVSACKYIWKDTWGARMEYILYNCLCALIEAGESLLSLPILLSNKESRERVLEKVENPKVRHFFETELAARDDKSLAEIVSPIQNKIGQLLTHPALRNILCLQKSSFSIEHLMNSGGILIVNLSKGRIGEEPANLLGSILVSIIGSLALARSVLPEATRKPFFLYIDEFQNFSTDSFTHHLSEVRKYKLGLILSHQFLGQLSDRVKQAVFGNVETRIFFALGGADAKFLESEIAPYNPSVLLDLKFGAGYMRQGGSDALPVLFYPQFDTRENRAFRTGRGSQIKEHSKQRFGRDRDFVEKIVRKVLFSKKQ